MRFSLRSSIQATGRPRRRASQTTTASSRASGTFWPKAPPTSGATTRRSDSGMPSRSQITVRTTWGICTEACSVVRPLYRSVAACEPRASSGRAAWRPETMSRSITVGAASSAAARPGVAISPATITFDSDSPGCTSGAPGARAASRLTAAGSGSMSSSTCSARSSASAAVSATTTATGSPTYRTRSRASSGWATRTYSGRCSTASMCPTPSASRSATV